MDTFDRKKLHDELVRDEGYRKTAYTDTLGKVTIGIGRNLTDVGITDDEVDYLYQSDVAQAEEALDDHIGWWRDLSDERQRVLVNMVFNMGWTRFSGFKRFLDYLQSQQWNFAAQEMLDSVWAQQVGQRAIRLANLMIGGPHDV